MAILSATDHIFADRDPVQVSSIFTVALELARGLTIFTLKLAFWDVQKNFLCRVGYAKE